MSAERFWCRVCWSLVPWGKGCADDADEVCSDTCRYPSAASDAGICDDCWYALGGADLSPDYWEPSDLWDEPNDDEGPERGEWYTEGRW